MKLMSPETRREIDTAIENAIKLASSGMHPTDAIVKVAKENNYNSDIGRLMARNFNVTKTLAHFETFKTDSEKRASEFDVADAEDVAKQLDSHAKDSAVKAASVPKITSTNDYLNTGISPEEFAAKYITGSKKVASEEIDVFLFEEYLKEKTKLKEKLAMLKTKAGQAEVRAEILLSKLADYVRDVNSFDAVEADVMDELGEKVAKHIFDSVESLVPFKELGYKRATASADIVKYPKVQKLAAELVTTMEEVDHYTTGYNKLAVDSSGDITLTSDMDRSSAEGLLMGSLLKDQISPALDKFYTQTSELLKVPEKSTSAVAPEDLRISKDLTSEVDTARASAIISDILSNDEVLSEEDPVLVAEMAKSQLELNPALRKYPALLASSIRRAIAARGDIDVQTARQLINLNKGSDKL